MFDESPGAGRPATAGETPALHGTAVVIEKIPA